MSYHKTKTGVIKRNPVGRKITAKHYDRMLEVLPPLTYGLSETTDFLREKDDNQEVLLRMKRAGAVGAFMQGEGMDRHDIYIATRDRNYYKVGRTKNAWNTEMFRYNNWRDMSDEEIKRYNR